MSGSKSKLVEKSTTSAPIQLSAWMHCGVPLVLGSRVESDESINYDIVCPACQAVVGIRSMRKDLLDGVGQKV